VVAPDFIGFGRSDKLRNRSSYTFALHHDTLAAFVQNLDLNGIALVCHDWGGLLGLALAVEMPERFVRLVIMNTYLPTGEEPVKEAFLKWRTASQRMKDMDIGRIVQRNTVTQLPVIREFFMADGTFPVLLNNLSVHSFRISAGDRSSLQARQLGTPYPRAIERHQYHAMKPSLGAVDEVGNFFRAQDAGQGSRLFRVRCIGHAPGFLDRLSVEEPKSGQPLRHGGRG